MPSQHFSFISFCFLQSSLDSFKSSKIRQRPLRMDEKEEGYGTCGDLNEYEQSVVVVISMGKLSKRINKGGTWEKKGTGTYSSRGCLLASCPNFQLPNIYSIFTHTPALPNQSPTSSFPPLEPQPIPLYPTPPSLQTKSSTTNHYSHLPPNRT